MNSVEKNGKKAAEIAGNAVEKALASASERVGAAADAASSKGKELLDAAHNKANAGVAEGERLYGQAKGKAQAQVENARTHVRENPACSLLAAAGAGFVLGVLLARK